MKNPLETYKFSTRNFYGNIIEFVKSTTQRYYPSFDLSDELGYTKIAASISDEQTRKNMLSLIERCRNLNTQLTNLIDESVLTTTQMLNTCSQQINEEIKKKHETTSQKTT